MIKADGRESENGTITENDSALIFANVVKLLIPGNFTFQFQTILRRTDSYVNVPKMAVL